MTSLPEQDRCVLSLADDNDDDAEVSWCCAYPTQGALAQAFLAVMSMKHSASMCASLLAMAMMAMMAMLDAATTTTSTSMNGGRFGRWVHRASVFWSEKSTYNCTGRSGTCTA